MRNFWCEIDLDKLDYNIKKIREKTDKKVMAVVKGNAYGLGIEVISEFLKDKVDAFAVSNIDEALRVQSDRDILVLNPVFSDEDMENMKDNFILTVDDMDTLSHLEVTGKRHRVHIYVDTGMNRFGVKPGKLKDFMKHINENFKNIEVDGIYTHLHNTGDYKYTINQINIFKGAISDFKDKINNIHILNSNGFLKYNEVVDIDNMIRIGNLIYGYDSRKHFCKRIFDYKAKPIRVYYVDKGEYIGYGNYFKSRMTMKVGILDVGYVDNFGFTKIIKNNIFYDLAKTIYNHIRYYSGILHNGKPVKIIGHPNMNFTIINMEGFEDETVFTIDLPPINADSSIPRIYRKGDSHVSV